MIINYLVSLVASYLTDAMSWYWYYPLLALAVVCTVPCIIKSLVR